MRSCFAAWSDLRDRLMRRRSRICAVLAGSLLAASSFAVDIPLENALTIETTFHGGLTSGYTTLAVADIVVLYGVTTTPESVVFDLSIVSNDAKAANLLAHPHAAPKLEVRRADLASSTRININWSSDEQHIPGQTFLTTSAAVLAALTTTGQSPLVISVREPGALDGLLGGFGRPAPGDKGLAPMVTSGMAIFFSGEKHYYHGVVHRLETSSVPFSVLLNGRRTTVPAVHASGKFKFADKELTAEFYWLDDPGDPLTLKYSLRNDTVESHELVTRIDQNGRLGAAGGSMAGGGGGGGGGGLGGKACHMELHGVYFSTGSAQLLPPSAPALKALAELVMANPSWSVTIEGHTDNIGSAAYNLDLSTRRANAVRDALIKIYRVAPGRLAAKGYGLTRPVETNATEAGRAHNRRVEVTRKCP